MQPTAPAPAEKHAAPPHPVTCGNSQLTRPGFTVPGGMKPGFQHPHKGMKPGFQDVKRTA